MAKKAIEYPIEVPGMEAGEIVPPQPTHIQLLVHYTGTMSGYHHYPPGRYEVATLPAGLASHLLSIGEAVWAVE